MTWFEKSRNALIFMQILKEEVKVATGLKSRIIYRVKEKDAGEANYWAGEYQLLIRAKSIPSPIGERNMVDTSTLEDLMETQEPGRRAAASMAVAGAFEKAYLDQLIEIEDQKLDIVVLYGTDGKGGEGICAFNGSESFAPDEASDDHLTGTCNIAISTVPRWIHKDYDVSVVEDEMGYPTSITLSAKTGGA